MTYVVFAEVENDILFFFVSMDQLSDVLVNEMNELETLNRLQRFATKSSQCLTTSALISGFRPPTPLGFLSPGIMIVMLLIVDADVPATAGGVGGVKVTAEERIGGVETPPLI